MNNTARDASIRDYDIILVRYNELGLKSQQVRRRMENNLMNYIRRMGRKHDIDIRKIERRSGRIIVRIASGDLRHAIALFRHLIGVYGFSPAYSSDKDFETVKQNALMLAIKELRGGDRFAVRVRRVKPYPYTAPEMERQLGAMILKHFSEKGLSLKVDLTSPDKTLYIEIRETEAYYYSRKYKTFWGGNPIEPGRYVISLYHPLLSPDRAHLAAQMMIRRGITVIPLVIESGTEGSGMQSGRASSHAIQKLGSVRRLRYEDVSGLIAKNAFYYPHRLGAVVISRTNTDEPAGLIGNIFNETEMDEIVSAGEAFIRAGGRFDNAGIFNDPKEIFGIFLEIRLLSALIPAVARRLTDMRPAEIVRRGRSFEILGVVTPLLFESPLDWAIAHIFKLSEASILPHFMPLSGFRGDTLWRLDSIFDTFPLPEGKSAGSEAHDADKEGGAAAEIVSENSDLAGVDDDRIDEKFPGLTEILLSDDDGRPNTGKDAVAERTSAVMEYYEKIKPLLDKAAESAAFNEMIDRMLGTMRLERSGAA